MIDEKRDKNARTWKTKKEEESHSIPDPDRASDRTINQFKIGIKARLMAPRKGYILKAICVHRKMHNKDFLSTNETKKRSVLGIFSWPWLFIKSPENDILCDSPRMKAILPSLLSPSFLNAPNFLIFPSFASHDLTLPPPLSPRNLAPYSTI